MDRPIGDLEMLSQRESSAGVTTPNKIFISARVEHFIDGASLTQSASEVFNDSEQHVVRPLGLETAGEHGDHPHEKVTFSNEASRQHSKINAEHPVADSRSIHSEDQKSVAASKAMSGEHAPCKSCKGKKLSASAKQFRRMAYGGWNRTLELSLVISVILGIVAVLFLAMALSSRMWRNQSFEYEDSNGRNVSKVNLGLRQMQRIQTLERKDNAGNVVIYDLPMKYDDVINSSYCASLNLSPATGVDGWTSESASDSTTARRLQEAEHADMANRENGEGVSSQVDLPLSHPFTLTIGRNPALPGAASEDLLASRVSLLGPTVYDVNCRDLPALRDAGSLLLKVGSAYLAFAALGLLSGILVLVYTSRRKVGGIRVHALAWFGAVSWLIAVLLHLAGLAYWGSTTDVAACVTKEGGAQVCPLGNSAAAALVTLSFSILAAVAHFMYLAHRSLSKLESSCQKREDDERTSGSQEVPPNSVVIEFAPLSRNNSNSSHGSDKASSAVFGPKEEVSHAAEVLQELEDFSAKKGADATHTDAGVSTEEHLAKPTAVESPLSGSVF